MLETQDREASLSLQSAGRRVSPAGPDELAKVLSTSCRLDLPQLSLSILRDTTHTLVLRERGSMSAGVNGDSRTLKVLPSISDPLHCGYDKNDCKCHNAVVHRGA